MRYSPGAAVVIIGVAAISCGGGSGSRASVPATPTAPTTPSTPTNTWSAAGQVVALGTTQGVGGATITPGWSLAAITADGDGQYQLGAVANPPTTPYPVSISAGGFVSHDAWITWARGPRTGVTLDLIRNAAPFSMEFYRQLVRDSYDKSDGYPWRNLRWTTAPSFYVKTVDQNGRPVEPEVLAVTLDALRRAVPAWTANHYTAAAIETGTGQPRPATRLDHRPVQTRSQRPDTVRPVLCRTRPRRNHTLGGRVLVRQREGAGIRHGPRSWSRAGILPRLGSRQRDVPVRLGRLPSRCAVARGGVPRRHCVLAPPRQHRSGPRSFVGRAAGRTRAGRSAGSLNQAIPAISDRGSGRTPARRGSCPP